MTSVAHRRDVRSLRRILTSAGVNPDDVLLENGVQITLNKDQSPGSPALALAVQVVDHDEDSDPDSWRSATKTLSVPIKFLEIET